MKIVELANVVRKQTHIYYRREFKADAVVEIMDRQRNVPLEFVLEHKPTGAIDVTTTIAADIDYPLMPLVNMLKIFILDLDKQGKLP